jgi:phosphatidylserine decarboxylase
VRIAPEGLPFIAVAGLLWIAALVAGVFLGGAWWIAAGTWTPITIWVVAFFRDPARRGPRGHHLVIAPADGVVVDVSEVDEPEVIRGPATRVSVFMNVFNVHVNRHPVTGTVIHRQYHAGRFFNATLDKASEHNERMSIGVESVNGPVLVRQIAGLVARRIVTDPAVGDAVEQGTRLGLIRFGSRVDTFLPPGARVTVRTGDRTVAGVTCIAEYSS